jgi:hypothetical protein
MTPGGFRWPVAGLANAMIAEVEIIINTEMKKRLAIAYSRSSGTHITSFPLHDLENRLKV